MKRLQLLLILISLVVIVTPWELAAKVIASPAEEAVKESIAIGGEVFRLEVASDDRSRAKGLQGRAEIDPSGGMIFVFPKCELRSFWMLGCKVDIDILFLGADGQIVSTHKMKAESPQRDDESQAAYEARLRRYSSIRPAQFAIELRAGSIDRLKLRAGQTIYFDRQRLVKDAR
jgi:uncharacterized membrane protein (UPF0127 family)